MIAIVGALVLTLIPLAYTGWLASMLFLQWGFGGWAILDWRDWLTLAFLIGVGVVIWILWWLFVGSNINISIGVSG